MTINRTTLLDLPLPVTGTESGVWGDITNNGLSQYLDIAIAGRNALTSANFTAGALTIDLTEGTASATNIAAGSAQYATLYVSSLAANSTITAPSSNRAYRVVNADATYTLTVKASGQTGVTFPVSTSGVVVFNGTDYVLLGTYAPIFNVDNLRLDGNTISSTDTNGNIVLAPNGTGDVQVDADTLRVGDSGSDATVQSNGNADLILKTGNATTGTLTLADGANGSLTLALNGTGQVIVNAGAVGTPTIAPTGDTNTGIFFPAADTIAFTEGGAEAMRIDSSGNVGIGRTPVAYSSFRVLDIAGSAGSIQKWVHTGSTVELQAYSSSTLTAIGSATNHPLIFTTNDTERMRIDSSGNVGIGTSAEARFTVGGDIAGAANSTIARIGTGDYTTNTVLSVAPGVVNFDAAGVVGGRFKIGSSGEIHFPSVGTTASAANAFLNNGSSPANQLLRSTSSIRYKTDVETLDPAKSEAVLNLRPVWYRSLAEADRKDWSWYGLIAEEVAEIEPRLVHWSYPESEYEEIKTEVEQERTVTDEDGNETTETYTETKTERKLKEDAQLAPDGVQYDRITVMLLDVVKRQAQTISALEARIAALEQE